MKTFVKSIMLFFLATLSLMGASGAQAQAPTVKVPQCVVQKDDIRIYVPCQGVVPVDTVTGNAMKWTDIITPTGPAGTPNPLTVSVQGNAAGTPIGTAGKTSAGAVTPICVDAAGAPCTPRASTSDRIITKTYVAAYTSAFICPARANVVHQEIQVSVANVGLGLNGQTLSAAVLGTSAAEADVVIATALGRYTFAVAPTNAISAYATVPFIASCIQTTRQ
jgi:hypothetical protein